MALFLINLNVSLPDRFFAENLLIVSFTGAPMILGTRFFASFTISESPAISPIGTLYYPAIPAFIASSEDALPLI